MRKLLAILALAAAACVPPVPGPTLKVDSWQTLAPFHGRTLVAVQVDRPDTDCYVHVISDTTGAELPGGGWTSVDNLPNHSLSLSVLDVVAGQSYHLTCTSQSTSSATVYATSAPWVYNGGDGTV